ncbi:MAG: tetratricopeptide repeat protein, partial [Chloroflexota bacterium]
LEKPGRAEEYLNQAIRLYQQIGDRYSIPAQLGNFDWTLLRQGEKERAKPYLLKAAELFDLIGLADYAERHRYYANR